MKKNYRHGEIGLFEIDKLPEGLVKSNSLIITKGSHGNDHSINKGDLYFKKEDDYLFGYLVAKDTMLQHTEHGNICSVCGCDTLVNTNVCPQCNTDFVKENKFRLGKIEDGVYQLLKQNEIVNSELKPVID